MNIDRLSESGKGESGTGESGTSRSYDSPKRRAQADATRHAIGDAARRLFLERGWSATRVRDVAALAGVSEPTVFAVYGSKAGLAMGLLDSLDAAADVPRMLSGLETAAGDPPRQLAELLGFDRRLFESGADAITVIREAGRGKPELAEVVTRGRARGDANRRRVFSSWPDGALRADTDVERASDVYAALSNVDVYLVLTRERGWSPDRVEDWWNETLRLLILR